MGERRVKNRASPLWALNAARAAASDADRSPSWTVVGFDSSCAFFAGDRSELLPRSQPGSQRARGTRTRASVLRMLSRMNLELAPEIKAFQQVVEKVLESGVSSRFMLAP